MVANSTAQFGDTDSRPSVRSGVSNDAEPVQDTTAAGQEKRVNEEQQENMNECGKTRDEAEMLNKSLNNNLNNSLNNTLNNSLNNRPIISQQLASKYSKDLQTKCLSEEDRIEKQHDIRARAAWLEAQGRKTRVGIRQKALLKGAKDIKEDTCLIPGMKEDTSKKTRV